MNTRSDIIKSLNRGVFKGCLHWPTSDNREGLILMPRNLSRLLWLIVHYYPIDGVKHFRWIIITHSWVLGSFRKFNIESIGWLRLMKTVRQSLIWPATYVHLLQDSLSLFNRQGDITLMEISLLIFYEKRQSLSWMCASNKINHANQRSCLNFTVLQSWKEIISLNMAV